MQPNAVYQAASRLAADSEVAARIQELRNTATSELTQERAWNEETANRLTEWVRSKLGKS